MVKEMNAKKDGQRGEIMLEASIIMVSVIIMLVGLLSINFFFYQESMLNTLATEIANDFANDYRYVDEDFEVNEQFPKNADSLPERNGFRYIFNEDAVSVYKENAEEYSDYQIGLRCLGIRTGNPTVECKFEEVGVGRAYVVVTVEHKSDFFLSEFAELAGYVDSKKADSLGRHPFSATVKAECDDLIGTASMVNLWDFTLSKLGVLNKAGQPYVDMKRIAEWAEKLAGEAK